ncbi:ribosome maturation factor RimM [Atopobacter phocae]|uniref:ribosome maturation factor RimM n=1 Tax=Atopobacter phocae TaxID=136492 RepID=UPI000470D9AE|nr:ribosome maturation factor RimM [Atopobacter phocae]
MRYLKVGKIVNTQGLKGELRIQSVTDQPEVRYKKGNVLFLAHADEKTPLMELKIVSYRRQKNLDILKFDSFNNINQVEQYKGYDLLVAIEENSDEINTEDGLYYFEIMGLTVETANGQLVGTITDILSPGANDVWVVTTDNKQTIYLPAIKDVIKAIDMSERKVVVELIEGLVE